MKKIRNFLSMALLASAFVFQSCEKNELDPIQNPDNIVPQRFRVEIPGSISSTAMRTKSTKVDTLKGNDIYEHLRNFINVGDHAADMVSDIIGVIAKFQLSRPLEFSFASDDDKRPKHVSIVENVYFENQNWEYKMTITDEGSDKNIDHNVALQFFWNVNPIKGVALLNPYNIDRRVDPAYAQVMYRVDYSEAKELAYEKHMIVTLTGFPIEDPEVEPYSISNLKMFVGKNGDVISLYGNTEHPNARFFTDEVGFNWAFTAAAIESADIAVAEVGLPPVNLDSDDRYSLLVAYSLKKVFEDQILSVWPFIPKEMLDAYLHNMQGPGFFNQGGFVQGGTAPTSQYNSLLNIIAALKPYNPKAINQLQLKFD